MGIFGVNKVIDTILKKQLYTTYPITDYVILTQSCYLESGVDIKTVSDRLGHSSIYMTTDVNPHITKKHKEENVSKLESYLNNSDGKW